MHSVLLFDPDNVLGENLASAFATLELECETVSSADDMVVALDVLGDDQNYLICAAAEDSTDARALADALQQTTVSPPLVLLDCGAPASESADGPLASMACYRARAPLTLSSWRLASHAARRWINLQADNDKLGLFRSIIGVSPQVAQLRQMVEHVADTDATVLVMGESGTGKEVVARTIYERSGRRDAPFVPLNCAAIPEQLVESELFGHEKGAFTGALSDRVGRFELADGGTLFLDEIGDMPLPIQAKLLRVLQEREYQRVGGNKVMRTNARIIAATNQNLEERVADGKFREDLFYRLNVFPVLLAPLRERSMDIPLLIAELAHRAEAEDRGSLRLTSAATQALSRYPWPGNVRELANLFERLLVLYPNTVVDVQDLPNKYRAQTEDAEPAAEIPSAEPCATQAQQAVTAHDQHVLTWDQDGDVDLRESVANLEMSLIRWAVDATGGVITNAATRLKINRTTLVEKMRKYRIPRS